MSNKRPSFRRLASYVWRHSFGRNKSSGDDHQMDADEPELQRNREEESELSEIPNLIISEPTGDSLTNEKNLSPITPELVQSLYSEDVTIQLEAMQKIHKLFIDTPSLPIEQVIKPGDVPRFIHFLEDSRYVELQFESAWVLTKMAFDNSGQTQVIIDAGAVLILIKLISSSDANVVEQSIWALGNIACHSTESRDLVLNSNVLPPLIGFLNDGNLSLSIMRKATWTLFNLCDKNVPPNFEQGPQCLSLCARLMFNRDDEILISVSWALAFLGEGSNEQIQIIIQSGICPRAVQLLSHSSTEIVKAAFCLVMKITTGDDSQARVLIDENVLPALFNLLFHEKKCIVENACKTLGKITSGDEQQIQAVIESNLISSLIELLDHRNLRIRQQAARAIRNATSRGTKEQIEYIVKAGAIPSLCKVLFEPDTGLTEDAVSGLVNILRTGESFAKEAGSTVNPYAVLICNSPKMALHSEDRAIQLEATKRFGKLLERSDGFNLIIDEVIKSGAIPRFVHFLADSRYRKLQCEAAWALTNISAGSSAQTQVVIDAGAVPVLIKLLTTSSNKIVLELSVWTLRDIACYSTESRDLVLNSNVLPALLGLFKDNTSLSLMRIATRTLQTLCGRKDPSPNFEQVSQCLPLLARLMVKEDEEMLQYICQALSRLCDGPSEQIQVVIVSGVCPRAVQLLSHTSTYVVETALYLVMNIAAGTASQAQVLINANALPALRSLLYHEKESIVKYACQTLANLCVESNEHIQVVIEFGVCPRAVQLLSHTSTEVVKAALRLMCKIAKGDAWQTQVLINAKALPVIGSLLSHEDESILEYAYRTLSNIAAGKKHQIQAVINANILPSLIELLHHRDVSPSVMRAATSTLSRLCQNSRPSFEQVSQCLPLLTRLMVNEDAKVLENVCWALSRLSDGPNEQIQVVIESGVCPRAVQLLSHTSIWVVKAALRLLCKIAMGDVLQTQVLINAKALPVLCNLLTHEKEFNLEYTCRTLSNMTTSGNEQQIQAVIDVNLLPSLIVLLHHRDAIIRRHVAKTIANATTNGSLMQVVNIVEAGVIPPFCQFLSEKDPYLIEDALSGLENILRTGKEISNGADATVNVYATFFKQCGGLDNISNNITLLSSHANVKIAQKAANLIEMYFI